MFIVADLVSVKVNFRIKMKMNRLMKLDKLEYIMQYFNVKSLLFSTKFFVKFSR